MSELVVVDTNIVVSALIAGNEDTLHRFSDPNFGFRSTNILIVELFEHSARIQEISHLEIHEITDVLRIILGHVRFIDDGLISTGSWVEAMRLCSGVDMDDLPFVALALELDCPLWTRDLRLKRHLIKNGFSSFFDPAASI